MLHILMACTRVANTTRMTILYLFNTLIKVMFTMKHRYSKNAQNTKPHSQSSTSPSLVHRSRNTQVLNEYQATKYYAFIFTEIYLINSKL